jgi:hypothetical protein
LAFGRTIGTAPAAGRTATVLVIVVVLAGIVVVFVTVLNVGTVLVVVVPSIVVATVVVPSTVVTAEVTLAGIVITVVVVLVTGGACEGSRRCVVLPAKGLVLRVTSVSNSGYSIAISAKNLPSTADTESKPSLCV